MPNEIDGNYKGMNEERFSRIRDSHSDAPSSPNDNRSPIYYENRGGIHRGPNGTGKTNKRSHGRKHGREEYLSYSSNDQKRRNFGGELHKAEESHKWDCIEAEFQLKQARNRSEIRIRKGRAHPIDILVAYAYWNEMDIEVGLPDPVDLLKEIPQKDKLEELQDAISVHLKWKDPNIEFWQAMLILCENAISELPRDSNPLLRYSGVHESVENEIHSMLMGKTYEELNKLQNSVVRKLQSGDAVETDYWESLLKSLIIYKAKACAMTFYLKARDKKIELISTNQKTRESQARKHLAQIFQPHAHSDLMEAPSEDLLILSNIEDDWPIILEVSEDIKRLSEYRDFVMFHRCKPVKFALETNQSQLKSSYDDSQAADVLYRREASKIAEENEEEFNSDVPVEQKLLSNGKSRLRKPRHFNRVISGYEWNKYNQTHYDSTNRPPRVVQGYKFNIFYPDLLDKSKAPSYILEDDIEPDSKIIRFTAGPPYEDIAFRILDKEWDLGPRSGYRCLFDKGVLHVHFRFRRYRYRR